MRGQVGVDFKLKRKYPLYGRIATSFTNDALDVQAKLSWLFDPW